MTRTRRAAALAALPVLLWAGFLAVGWAASVDYATRPGAVGEVPARWPAGAAVERSATKPTLLLFAHPLCPCTRATVAQLAELVARCGERLSVHVLMRDDPRPEGALQRTELWRDAAAIPGVALHADPLGAQARLFGAETSGHAMLFAPGGERLFSGGLTASRGHEGDSAGAAAVVELAFGRASETRDAPVFGCGLLDPDPPAPVAATR